MLAYLYINDQEDMRSCNYINDDLRNQITELEKENETLNKKWLCFNNPLMWISTLKPPNFCKKFGGFKI